MDKSIHGSIIRDSKTLKTTEVSINRKWINCGLLLQWSMEQWWYGANSKHSMDESQTCWAKEGGYHPPNLHTEWIHLCKCKSAKLIYDYRLQRSEKQLSLVSIKTGWRAQKKLLEFWLCSISWTGEWLPKCIHLVKIHWAVHLWFIYFMYFMAQ